MKRRFIWTPDELAEVAENCYKAVFGDQSVEVEKNGAQRPIPVLLPKPVRPTPGPKGESITITALRKAQRAERKRRKFNSEVKRSLRKKSKKLEQTLRTQAKSALSVEKACNRAHKAETKASKARAKAQAEAALAMMRKARQEAEHLRAQIAAARAWLSAERHRQRYLDQMVRVRIEKAKAWGIIPSWFDDEDWED